MKKILLLLTMAAAVLSCSDDGGSSAAPKRVSSITLAGPGTFYDRIYNFSYDGEGRIFSIVRTGDGTRTYNFTYAENNIATMALTINNSTTTYTFNYDSDGKITTFLVGSMVVPANYNPQTNGYSYTVNSIQYAYALNDIGDVDSVFETQFSYNTSKNGPLMASPVAYHFLGPFLLDEALTYILSKRPIEHTTYEADTWELENTYADGMIKESVIPGADGDELFTATFEYED